MMVNKKMIQIATISIIVMFLAVSFVSAGLLDSIKKVFGAGEVQEAPFEASVQLANAPPSIITILPTTDVTNANVPIAGSGLGQVDIITGTTDYAVVKFVVDDPNLPTIPGDLSATPTILAVFGTPTVANNEIGVRLTSPAVGIRCVGPGCRNRDAATALRPTGSATTCSSVICTADADCLARGYTAPENARRRAFTCYVQMQYFDEPITTTPPTAGNQMWSISLYIEDNTGNSASATSATFADVIPAWNYPGDELFYVWVRPSTDVDISPSTERIEWTSLSVTTTDNLGADGNAVDTGTGLTLRNIGNRQVNSIDITPQNLLGTVNPAAILFATAFGVGLTAGGANSGACDVNGGGGTSPWEGIALTGGAPLANFLRTIPFTADTPAQGLPLPATSAMQDLFFCIWPAIQSGGYLGGVGSDLIYRATGGVSPYSAGQYWELVLNS